MNFGNDKFFKLPIALGYIAMYDDELEKKKKKEKKRKENLTDDKIEPQHRFHCPSKEHDR